MDGERYIKLFEKMKKWEWYQDTYTKVVFLHLLLDANYMNARWRGINIKRGQCICGLHKLAKELNISVQNVRTALNHLELTNEITSESSNKGRLITITNYDDYQVANKPSNTKLTTNQQAANKQLTTKEEEIEEKNNNTTYTTHAKEKKSATRLLIETIPNEWMEWAVKDRGWNNEVINDVWEEFVDYWQNQPANKGKKTNWKVTWRNWCRRQQVNNQSKGNQDARKPEPDYKSIDYAASARAFEQGKW